METAEGSEEVKRLPALHSRRRQPDVHLMPFFSAPRHAPTSRQNFTGVTHFFHPALVFFRFGARCSRQPTLGKIQLAFEAAMHAVAYSSALSQ